MTRAFQFGLLGILAILGIGCEKKVTPTGVVGVASDAVSNASKAVDAAGDAVAKAKEALHGQFGEQLKVVDAKIAELKTKAAAATGDAKAALEKKAADLAKYKDDAAKLLEEAKTATADKWADVKARGEKLAADLKKAVEDAGK